MINKITHKDYYEVHEQDFNDMMQLSAMPFDEEIPSFTQGNNNRRPNHSLDLPLTLKPLTLTQKINAVKQKHALDRARYERNRRENTWME